MPLRAAPLEKHNPGVLEWRDSNNWVHRWLYWVISRPRRALLVRALILLALGAWLDIQTGLQLSIFAFYFVPIFIMAFMVSPTSGVVGSLLAAATRAGASYIFPGREGDLVISAWNFTVDGVSFLIFAFLLSSVREQLDREVSLGRRDPLTRAYNRRAFEEQVDIEIARLKRSGPPFTLIYLDLDNFKLLNDTAGHEAGDVMLERVASTLVEELRDIDTVARLGGDEFGVLMPQTNRDGAELALPRLQAALRTAVQDLGGTVTFSMGSVTFLYAPDSFDAALREADKLMYQAKNGGKDIYFHGVHEAPLVA